MVRNGRNFVGKENVNLKEKTGEVYNSELERKETKKIVNGCSLYLYM